MADRFRTEEPLGVKRPERSLWPHGIRATYAQEDPKFGGVGEQHTWPWPLAGSGGTSSCWREAERRPQVAHICSGVQFQFLIVRRATSTAPRLSPGGHPPAGSFGVTNRSTHVPGHILMRKTSYAILMTHYENLLLRFLNRCYSNFHAAEQLSKHRLDAESVNLFSQIS